MDSDQRQVGHARPQMPESVYRDAVTKLRILLEATEAASNVAAEVENETEAPKLSKNQEVRQINFVGSVDRNIDRLKVGEETQFGGFSSADRKNPKFVKSRAAKIGGVKRALFVNESKYDEDDSRRYNSWHNLVYNDGDFNRNDATNDISSKAPMGDLRSLIEKQELYIAQLEKETKFCREQLAKVLSQVQDTWPSNSPPDVAASLKTFQKMLNEYSTLTNVEDFQRLKLENAMLRQKLEAVDLNNVTNSLIEKLKRDNTILLQTINQVREESEENVRRECEAVEQVKRSVQAAEQARMEKHELEFEIDQLKMQVDRQQTRIRSLIEEQDCKVDEERTLIERRAQEQVRQAREESETQAGEVGRLMAELERLHRLEIELRRQLKDRDRVLDDFQQEQILLKLFAESEKRLGQLQLEIVNGGSTRQQLEHELGCIRLDLDAVKQELRSERSRHETEVDSLRGRLKRTEEQLVNAREETLSLSESKAGLEREVNLLKLQLSHLHQAHQQSESKLLQAKSAISANPSESKNEKFVEAKLRDLIQRQSKLISELKRQCLLVADKLETTSTEATKEINHLQVRLDRIVEEKKRVEGELLSAQAQCKEFGRVYEKSVRRLEVVEVDFKRSCDDVERLQRQIRDLTSLKTTLEEENAFLKRRQTSICDEKSRRDHIMKQAIVIERNGQVSSPFVK